MSESFHNVADLTETANILLNRRGGPEDVIAAFDEFERSFPDNLNAILFAVSQEMEVSVSSWEDIRATVSAIVEEDPFQSPADFSHHDVLKHAEEQYDAPPERSSKRSRYENTWRES